VTPRDTPRGSGDGGGVARALAAAPAALHDLTPRAAARALVHLRREHGESADLVSLVSAAPEMLLKPPPDRDDSDAAKKARARRRREAALRDAGGAMRTVTARVEARVIDKDRLDKNKNNSSTGDGRTDGGASGPSAAPSREPARAPTTSRFGSGTSGAVAANAGAR
jgi:hypothetical protein